MTAPHSPEPLEQGDLLEALYYARAQIIEDRKHLPDGSDVAHNAAETLKIIDEVLTKATGGDFHPSSQREDVGVLSPADHRGNSVTIVKPYDLLRRAITRISLTNLLAPHQQPS
jgi:hypothetical protein